MDKMSQEGDLIQKQYNTCLRGSQVFYKESLKYVLAKMDMSESLWSHACWVNFFNRENSFWSDVEDFVNSFSSILQFDKQEMNLLYEQFGDFQTSFEEELPNGALAVSNSLKTRMVKPKMSTEWMYSGITFNQ